MAGVLARRLDRAGVDVGGDDRADAASFRPALMRLAADGLPGLVVEALQVHEAEVGPQQAGRHGSGR